MAAKPKIIVLDDNEGVVRSIALHLKDEFEIVGLTSAAQFLPSVDGAVQAVVMDERLPGASGVDLLCRLQALRPNVIRILMTAWGEECLAAAINNAGIFRYIAKPPDFDQLRTILREAAAEYLIREQGRLRIIQKRALLEMEGLGFSGFAGSSRKLAAVAERARQVADLPVSVLIQGESGTGKDVLARAIHYEGSRPFLRALNCGGLSDTLLETTMFGSVKGAFTDAVDRKGAIEEADGGTLFLDEVGEMSLAFQKLLLRFLDSGEFSRVGSAKQQRAHVRIIAATNRNLKEEVKAQRFRQDLYYRLAQVELFMPSLRERPEDIPALAAHFLQQANTRFSRRVQGFSADAMAALCRYSFPGNVRELLSAVEQAVIFCGDQMEIKTADLPDSVFAAAPDGFSVGQFMDERTLQFECNEIRIALEKTGTQAEAARLLGCSTRGLQKKLRRCRDRGVL